jgi:hypothetical protein
MLALLSQPPILKKEEEPPAEQKEKCQETWLLRAAALVGAVVGSQLALLAELYEHRLGGFISSSFDTLKRSYQAYCEEEKERGGRPEKELLDSFAPCRSWIPQMFIKTCKEKGLPDVEKTRNQLSELFCAAGKGPGITERVKHAHVWYERIHMREQLKESGYAKPIYVLVGGDVPLLKETVYNFQPGFLNWTSTLIYSVAGGVFAVGAVYMAIHTARWLHGALLVQPSKTSVRVNPPE